MLLLQNLNDQPLRFTKETQTQKQHYKQNQIKTKHQ